MHFFTFPCNTDEVQKYSCLLQLHKYLITLERTSEKKIVTKTSSPVSKAHWVRDVQKNKHRHLVINHTHCWCIIMWMRQYWSDGKEKYGNSSACTTQCLLHTLHHKYFLRRVVCCRAALLPRSVADCANSSCDKVRPRFAYTTTCRQFCFCVARAIAIIPTCRIVAEAAYLRFASFCCMRRARERI